MVKWRAFSIAALSALMACQGLAFIATSAVAADAGPETSKRAAEAAEQSPEEAAGGRQNLLRIRKACEEDIKKLCPQIRPGGGRIIQCLQGQPSNLSPACRQVLGPRSSNP